MWYADDGDREPALKQWKSWLDGNGGPDGGQEHGLAGGGDEMKQR